MLFRSFKDYRAFLRDNGYKAGSLDERSYNMLADNGATPGHIGDMWREFLVGLGYTGASVQEMAYKWELDGFTIGPSVLIQDTGVTTSTVFTGDEANITAVMSDASPISSYKWGSTPGGTEYGTAANPDPYTEGFPGGTLYVEVVSGGQTYSSSAAIDTTDFVMTVETTSSPETFTMGFHNLGTVTPTIEWGDGSSDTITAYNDAALAHSYATAGTYTIRMRGTAQGGPNLSATQAAKIRTVENLGNTGFNYFLGSFEDTTGMTSFTAGNTNAAPSTMARFMDNSRAVTIDLTGLNTANVDSFRVAFANNPNLTTFTGIDTFDTSSLEQADEMFWNSPNLNTSTIDISGWDFTALLPRDGANYKGLFNFIPNSLTLPTSVMDALYVNMDAQVIAADTWFSLKGSSWTRGGAVETARTSLINKGINLEDDGNAAPDVAAAPSTTVDSSTQITVTLPSDPFSNGLQISDRALDFREGVGAWSEFGSGYAEGQTVAVTALTPSTQHGFRISYTNPLNYASIGGTTDGLEATATTDVASGVTAVDGDEEGEFNIDGSGNITVTYSAGPYAGTYNTDPRDASAINVTEVDTAPVPYFRGSISGTEEVGQTLTVLPALWLISDNYADPTPVTLQWRNSATGDIPGATNTTYVLQASDVGDTITVRATLGGETVDTLATGVIAAATPDAFVDADWSVATGSGANELDITIASLPSDGGSAITDIEYDVDASGSWISLATATTGTTTVTMAAPSTSYGIRLRAVNAIGNGAAGNTESATSGAGASGVVATFRNSTKTSGLEAEATTKNLTIDMSSHDTGQDIIMMMTFWAGSATPALTGATLDGNANTALVSQTSVTSFNPFCAYVVFPAGSYAASSTLALTFSANTFEAQASFYNIPSGHTISLLDEVNLETAGNPVTMSGSCLAGDAILVSAQVNGETSLTFTAGDFSPASGDATGDIRSDELFLMGSVSNIAGTSVSATITDSGLDTEFSGQLVRITP